MYQILFPAVSRDASWAFTGKVTDINDNPLDMTGMTLVYSIVDKRGIPRLKATTDDGSITIIGLGLFRWFFNLQQMQTLWPGTYQTGFTITTADRSQTVQFFRGPLPVIIGNMSPWSPPS